jgi:selenocysteine-specific elongation factor
VAGTFLEGAPLVPVSARTGAGLDTLRDALRTLARARRDERVEAGLLRLPLDRAFSLRGFGTVVTGTLRSGRLRVGDEVEAMPAGARGRVRSIEVHGESRNEVSAGHRTAVNLAGIEVRELARGDVLGAPGTLRPTSMLDVELTLLASARPLPDGAAVRVHAGTAEAAGRVRLLGGEALPSGGRAVAQLSLERPLVAARADRLILRSPSPPETIAGARVLNPWPPRRRPADRTRLEGLAALADDDAAGAARLLLDEADLAGMELGTLAARLSLPTEDLRRDLAEAPGVVLAASSAWSPQAIAKLARKARATLAEFHRSEPLREAMPLEALRQAVCGRRGEAFEPVLASLVAEGQVRKANEGIAAADHVVRLDDAETALRRRLVEAAQAAGWEGFDPRALPASGEPEKRRVEGMLRALVEARVLRRLADGRILDGARLEGLVREVRARWPPGSRLDVADFKSMTGLTRRLAIPLLEQLDRDRVTRRVGTDRVVL